MLKARIGLLLAAALTLASASPATAADSPAFWGYWQATGSHWAFAKTGPATSHPKDGSVEGWRFAKSSGNAGTPPTGAPDFKKVCGSTPAQGGSKRVAVVVDDGQAADAPKGQHPAAPKSTCAVVPDKATGSDVLAFAAQAQTDKSGLICAIDAFGPCAAAAPAPSASSTAAPARKKSSGSKIATFGVGLILVLAAAGSYIAVQRRSRG